MDIKYVKVNILQILFPTKNGKVTIGTAVSWSRSLNQQLD